MRGDLIPGGLKTLALLRWLPTLNHTHFAYTGSVYGSGAWAVATVCRELGYDCSLFIARSNYDPAWLKDVKPATLYWCEPLPVNDLHQQTHDHYPELYNLPLGFDTPDFIDAMADAMYEILSDTPPEIWIPAVSGVLARAACLAFPDIPIHAVLAARHAGDTGQAIRHEYEGKFHRAPASLPPYPACPFSDAKAWEVAKEMAVPGAVLWNVSL